MKVIDCFWEKRNLGCDTVEITVDTQDLFSRSAFSSYSEHEYVVVKVPVNKMDFNIGLSELGYILIELQIEMGLRIKDFNYDNRFVKSMEPDLIFQTVDTENELEDILKNISNEMFTTDRVFIDPQFGPDISRRRYVNWIIDEFERKTAKIVKLYYKDEHVGFSMFREGEVVRGLLGGIYSTYQKFGIGVLTPTHLPILVKRDQMHVKRIIGDISSNNMPVWELYELFGYKTAKPRYVFVKHNSITK